MESAGEFFVCCSDDGTGGLTADDFFGVIGAREDGDLFVGVIDGDDFGHAASSVALDAFSTGEEDGVFFERNFAESLSDFRGAGAGDHEDDEVGL